MFRRERFGRAAVPARPSPTPLGSDADDIPIIPDLDDYADIDFTPTASATATAAAAHGRTSIAAAAAVTVNRVAAYRELNSDLLKMGAFAALDGVDLTILTRCLAAEADLHEPDEVWTWDGLFAEVAAADMHASTAQ